MQGTNRIYEEPSRVSQGLVIALSIAVVAMAGWLATTITLSQTAMTSGEDAIDAVTGAQHAMSADGTAASLPTTLRQPQSNSVHFDWPTEFASTPSATPPTQPALPVAPTELPTARDSGRAPWPAVPEARDRNLPSRASPGATEPTDAIVDILLPPSPTRSAATATPAPQARQAQRRQKPRPETEATSQTNQ
jgi:hypothetical protein